LRSRRFPGAKPGSKVFDFCAYLAGKTARIERFNSAHSTLAGAKGTPGAGRVVPNRRDHSYARDRNASSSIHVDVGGYALDLCAAYGTDARCEPRGQRELADRRKQ
jgi:hypothetical protein